jgi:hypothetical protein
MACSNFTTQMYVHTCNLPNLFSGEVHSIVINYGLLTMDYGPTQHKKARKICGPFLVIF